MDRGLILAESNCLKLKHFLEKIFFVYYKLMEWSHVN